MTRSSTKSKLPAALVAALEAAWADREDITCVTTMQISDGHDWLDRAERNVRGYARDWASENGRVVLGLSAPIWSRIPKEYARIAAGKTNAAPHATEQPWERGGLLALDDVLVCRVKATTIPQLPNLTEVPA